RALAASSVRPDDMHIRFHREAHAAASLHITGGFSRIGDGDADIVLLLHHSLTGTLSASFRLTVRHVQAEGAPAIWPAAFAGRAGSFAVDIPKEAQARGTGSATIPSTPPDLAAHTRIALNALTG